MAWGLKLAFVLLGLLAMTQQSMQFRLHDPVHQTINKINEAGSYIGLVINSDNNEKALNESNSFTYNNAFPTVIYAGRKFHVGTLNGKNLIYVKTGDGVINAASTVQVLIDKFRIEGIVHYGSAGAVNDSLFIGDVGLITEAAYTGAWNWKSNTTKKGTLKFGAYNLPTPGNNEMNSVDFGPSTLFNYSTGTNKTVFFLNLSNTTWFNISAELEVEFEQCLTSTKCLPRAPVLVNPVRISTDTKYVQNKAYRSFLNTQFKASLVDQETAAIVLTAYSNNVTVVAFKGVSNTAGGSTSYKSYSYLGSVNAFKVASALISSITLSSETSSTPTRADI